MYPHGRSLHSQHPHYIGGILYNCHFLNNSLVSASPIYCFPMRLLIAMIRLTQNSVMALQTFVWSSEWLTATAAPRTQPKISGHAPGYYGGEGAHG